MPVLEMTNDWTYWILAILAVEDVAEILTNGELFAPAKKWLKRLAESESVFRRFGWWAHGLWTCWFCMSVWASGFFTAGRLWLPDVARTLAMLFSVHLLARVLHEGMYRWTQRHPFMTFPSLRGGPDE